MLPTYRFTPNPSRRVRPLLTLLETANQQNGDPPSCLRTFFRIPPKFETAIAVSCIHLPGYNQPRKTSPFWSVSQLCQQVALGKKARQPEPTAIGTEPETDTPTRIQTIESTLTLTLNRNRNRSRNRSKNRNRHFNPNSNARDNSHPKP